MPTIPPGNSKQTARATHDEAQPYHRMFTDPQPHADCMVPCTVSSARLTPTPNPMDKDADKSLWLSSPRSMVSDKKDANENLQSPTHKRDTQECITGCTQLAKMLWSEGDTSSGEGRRPHTHTGTRALVHKGTSRMCR